MKGKPEPMTAWEIKQYVDKRLQETGSDNMAIHLPSISPVMIRALQKHYRVSRGLFGYIRFEVIEPKAGTKA